MDTTEDDWKRITIFFAVRTSLPQFVLFEGVIDFVHDIRIVSICHAETSNLSIKAFL